jgi:hypothetical protein
LKNLTVCKARGLGNHLAIHSDSLLLMELWFLDGLQKLTIVAPELDDLHVFNCFARTPQVIDISAPKLESLMWKDPYDLRTVHMSYSMQLRRLVTGLFHVYGQDDSRTHNRDYVISLLRGFWAIHTHSLPVIEWSDKNTQYKLKKSRYRFY